MILDPLSKKLLVGAGNNGPISLMYHAIAPGNKKTDWPWSLSFKNFCEHLALLQDYDWTPIRANQLVNDFASLPPRSVLITFDDGYSNNYPAFEELAKRNMKASWFIVTQDIGQDYSWVEDNAPLLSLLSKSQIKEMHAAGMEIGSHSHSHRRLTEVSQSQLDLELAQSRTVLSDILGETITSFAYPYGAHDQTVLSATRAAGYQVAFTTRSGFGLANEDLLQVRRLSIMAEDSLARLARKLAFADNDVSWYKMGKYFSGRLKSRVSKHD